MSYLARFAGQQGTTIKPPDNETYRIVNLPVTHPQDTDLTYLLRRPEWPAARDAEIPIHLRNLRPIQSAALHTIYTTRGACLPISAGDGKSLIALMAGTVLDAEFLLVVTPAQTKSTLLGTYFEARKYYKMAPKVEIIAAEDLQQPRTTDLLEELLGSHDPKHTVLAIDEAQAFQAIRTSARAKRLRRFVLAHPEIAVAAMSGTLLSRSLRDISHIFDMCLHAGSPIPRDRTHLDAWAEIVDPKGGKPGQLEWEIFKPVWSWYQQQVPGTPDINTVYGTTRDRIARKAFGLRLASTAGVVRSTSSMVKAKLVIHGLDVDLPGRTTELLERAVVDREDPEHEPIPDDVTRWRLERQIAQGFHYRWAWERTPFGTEDKDWLRARSDWNRHVRFELEHAHTGYDSPKLVYDAIGVEVLGVLRDPLLRAWAAAAPHMGKDTGNDAWGEEIVLVDADDPQPAPATTPSAANKTRRKALLDAWAAYGADFAATGARAVTALRESLHKAWAAWSVQRRKDPPPTEPVWHSPFLVLHAVAWAAAQPDPVSIWYSDDAIGEALAYMGLTVYGPGDQPPQYPAPAQTAAFSIRAHGIGKNLQNYKTMLIMSPPSSSETWEQLLARVHRARAPGEPVEQVNVYVYVHTDSNLDAIYKSRKASRAIEDSTDTPLRLVHATYEGIQAMPFLE